MKAFAVVCLALVALSSPALAGRLLQQAQEESQQLNDTQILNYALNLEYLEAEFYSCAAFGQPIAEELRGGGPASSGCQKANLGAFAQALAEEVANDEIAHVRLLREALGEDAVAMPQLNIGSAFADAANAAFGGQLEPEFSPYVDDILFYHGAFIFEDVGVTAYAGAAGLIEDSSILGTAARILAVESYHAGTFRTLLYQNRDLVTPWNVTVAEVVEAISDLRDSVDGPTDLDQPIVTLVDGEEEANVVPADENALVFTRTPEEIINIVTLGSGANGGGFFPQGIQLLNNEEAEVAQMG